MEKPIDNLIQILQKQKKKIITADDLKKFIYSAFWDSTPIRKIYKITFQLKNRWFLFPLRKDLFFISNPEKVVKSEEIEEQWYWKLLKDRCNESSKHWYLGWLTALEIYLHWNGVTIPESIIIVNKEKQVVEILMFEKRITFKKFETKWKSLLSQLIKQTNEINMPNCKKILVANLELSILECLYNFDTTNRGYIEECIKKAIKKNGKSLNMKNLEMVIKLWKHNTSLNRLYSLIKMQYPSLAEWIKNLIKKYGFVL